MRSSHATWPYHLAEYVETYGLRESKRATHPQVCWLYVHPFRLQLSVDMLSQEQRETRNRPRRDGEKQSNTKRENAAPSAGQLVSFE
jgi:hypothetical protein